MSTRFTPKYFLSCKKAAVAVEVEQLKTARNYSMAATTISGTESIIKCFQVVRLDFELHIRHGTALVLRNCRWLVTNQKVGEPPIGRSLFEYLRLNTREIFSVVEERYAGVFDVSQAQKMKTLVINDAYLVYYKTLSPQTADKTPHHTTVLTKNGPIFAQIIFKIKPIFSNSSWTKQPKMDSVPKDRTSSAKCSENLTTLYECVSVQGPRQIDAIQVTS